MYTRESNFPGRVRMVEVPGQPGYFDMVRADDPVEPGTPLTAETFLKDATAALFGIGPEGIPDDVLQVIAAMLNNVSIVTGSYTGTGVSKTQTIDLGFRPSAVILAPKATKGTGYIPYILTTEAPTADGVYLSITTSGFSVGNTSNVSDSAQNPYRYIAWR